MIEKIGAFEAKTNLSKLLERVRKGERFTITRHGTPIAMLVPINVFEKADISAAIDELKEIKSRTKAGPETLRELIEEGRRF